MRNKKIFTEKLIINIIKDYENGLSARLIADKYGSYKNRILEILKERNVHVREQWRRKIELKLTEEQIDQVCVEYKSGILSPQLGEKYGVSDTTIRKYLNRRGIFIKKIITQADEIEICNKYKAGLTIQEIIRTYHFHTSDMYKILEKYKVERRPPIKHIYGSFTEHVGKTYGSLLVIEEFSAKKDKKFLRFLNCQCICGKLCSIIKSRVLSGNTTSCGCSKINRPHRGFGDISGKHWSKIVEGARSRNLEFNIDIKYAWELFEQQNRTCIYSGLPLMFKNKFGSTASLDRIDSSKGYIKGNVQWVHRDINIMKWSFDEEYFISLCHAISNRNK